MVHSYYVYDSYYYSSYTHYHTVYIYIYIYPASYRDSSLGYSRNFATWILAEEQWSDEQMAGVALNTGLVA